MSQTIAPEIVNQHAARCPECRAMLSRSLPGETEQLILPSRERRNQRSVRARLDEVKARMEQRNECEITYAYVVDRLLDVWWYHENGGQRLETAAEGIAEP